MKRSPHFCFLLLLSLSAFALDQGHARYVGGTVPGLTAESLDGSIPRPRLHSHPTYRKPSADSLRLHRVA
jgi:hypothetical protein